ncbi:MAG: diguanylate cyclase/phosphodiesterase (GGDEF & EAL domains) with PAS/PAC sensor(s) [Rhodanobacteraceae bacterium]|jgi:diguanylate cyclase (GGDEF)-like protein|nr:MAG: diguanylate cyclase/phosphodiesterase (GGDEF & EAL domains) with PAS/PAC sensor(s) [Rhodanobacteraceae bacterium]
MRKLLPGLLLCGLLSTAFAASPLSEVDMRTLSAGNPRALIAKVRAALDDAAYANDPAGEREALWWMGHAGVNISDDAAVTEAVARLKSLGSVGHDTLAASYAGFLTADLRIVHGDGGGVGDALQAAALQLDSPDPAHRALAKFQLCDAYSMAGQYQHSQPLCEKADAAFGALHDDWDQAQAKNDEGNDAYGLGEYAEAGKFYEDARALYRKVGDRAQELMVGDNLAQVYLKQGRPAQALALSQASLANERAAGRESDALNSQYDIARALEALGRRSEAMALIASTVEEARKGGLGSLLPDLLEQQSQLAEHDGNLKLALSAEREALEVSRQRWSNSLRSQQAELAARYAAREKEIRIQELERNNQIKNLKLRTAEADAARNAMQVRRQRSSLLAVLVAASGLLVGIVSLLLLLRSQRRHAVDLRRQALEDPLTGVDNRRGFFRRAQELLDRRGADRPPLHALLLFDFDYFKLVNDRYGHPFGDIVLNVSLQRLREVVGKRGHLARLGGEEFIVLCPRIGGAQALQLAEAMREAVAELVFPNAPNGLEVTISIGVALFDGTRSHDVGSWLRSADNAMYAAKARGRDQIVVAQAVNDLLSQAGAESQPAT